MTLNRRCATAVLARHWSLIHGRILELGVGEIPYARTADTIALDIDLGCRPNVNGDAHALPFASGCFDTVVASQVFEHLHSPDRALGEVARVLKPGGNLVLAIPFLFFLHQLPHDYQRLTGSGIEKLFDLHPFNIDVEAFGGRIPAALDLLFTPTPSSSVVRRGARKLRKIIAPPHPERPTRLGEWLSRRDAHEFPMGYVVVAKRLAR
jgi:SAM-dependent methyltransferase